MALTNNDILKKLRVALKMRDDDIVEVLALVDFRISKGEIGNFCRSEDHPKYVKLKDQVLRNFLNGLIIYKRGPREDKRPKTNSVSESSLDSSGPDREESNRGQD